MRRFVTLAFVAAVVSFVAGGAYAGGLVNGNFEDSTDVGSPGLGGWTYWDSGAGSGIGTAGWTDKVPPDAPGPHSGTGYAYIHVQDDGSGWPNATVAQVVDLTGQVGTRLMVSYWYNINQTQIPPQQYVDIHGFWSNPGVSTPPAAGWNQWGLDAGSDYYHRLWWEAKEDYFDVSGVWTQKVWVGNVTDQNQGVTLYHPNYFAFGINPHSYTPNSPQDYSIALDDVKIYLIPPGDANQDGAVSVGDLGILAANYGTTGGATWTTSDFNGDGNVTVGDLGILAANYGVNNLAGGAVPEPATLSLLGLGVLALRRRR